ncbi:HD domain-containing protein [Candidatus Woesearchaeota archaeon]|mgnify:FL=1|jgi:putative nucleotidyltransferase with HDIG domain|nr:HD domain-containing protein [Candidatus Woesearchaeota archaeon]MBT6518469.1 HD domain-containing protein [Candidatus Woesearchaeota archaeon]MBT7366854.1 HD domain-containing protein [Candidatus Woesearchaeota archaeon]
MSALENTLDQRLNEAYTALSISDEQRFRLETYSNLVKIKDIPSYYHSVRCALHGIKIAELLYLDPKAMFYAGLLHDVGKSLVDSETLKKTEGFDSKDMVKMKLHVKRGYEMLKDTHPFSAEIIARHHIYSRAGYPKQIPKAEIGFSTNSWVLIHSYSRLLSIIDFYDAASTRENDKFGEKRLPTADEVKDLLIKVNPDQQRRIEAFYDKEIFGKSIEDMFGVKTEVGDMVALDKLVFCQKNSYTLPERIGKYVMLCAVLEPIPDKEGCTTRFVDIKPSKALKYFLAGGVNIGPPFMRLAAYLERSKTVKGSYRFAKDAQIASKDLRMGGKINQGIIEFITPLVNACVLLDPERKENPADMFKKATELLHETHEEDVTNLIGLKKIGNEQSNVTHKYPVREHDAKTVFEYYEKELEIEQEENNSSTSIGHNLQFVNGFQDIKLGFETFMNSKTKQFEGRLNEAYKSIYAKEGNENLGVGLVADFSAALLFMALRYANEEIIV